MSDEIARRDLIGSVTLASGATTSDLLRIKGYVMGNMTLPGGGLKGDLRYKTANMVTQVANHKFQCDDTAAIIKVGTAAQRSNFPRNVAVRPEAMIAESIAINMTTATTAEKTIDFFSNG
jgi:hypothetical protein